jgi:hypothetical protein
MQAHRQRSAPGAAAVQRNSIPAQKPEIEGRIEMQTGIEVIMSGKTNGQRTPADRAHERTAELLTEVNELRALLAVVLDDFEASDRRPGRRMQFDRYRELGGLEARA